MTLPLRNYGQEVHGPAFTFAQPASMPPPAPLAPPRKETTAMNQYEQIADSIRRSTAPQHLKPVAETVPVNPDLSSADPAKQAAAQAKAYAERVNRAGKPA